MSEPAEGQSWQQLVDECLVRGGDFRPEQLGFTKTDPNIWRKPNRDPKPPLFWLSMRLTVDGPTIWELRYGDGECPTCGRKGERQTIFQGRIPDTATAKVVFGLLDLPKKHQATLCRTSDAA